MTAVAQVFVASSDGTVLITSGVSQPSPEGLYGPRDDDAFCPRSVDQETGEISRYYACNTNRCLFCVRQKVRRLSWRISRVEPTQMLTVTDLPICWEQARPALTEFRRLTKRAGYDWSWLYNIERDPNLVSAHLHSWAKGDLPPIDVLTASAARAGMGTVHRQPVTHYGGMDYQWKDVGWNAEALADAKTLNGPRLWHASPNFLAPRPVRPVG